jgi:hypothetical protein
MKSRPQLFVLITLALISLMVASCRTLDTRNQQGNARQPSPDRGRLKAFTILMGPENRTVHANAYVVYGVRVHPEYAVKYQWMKNGKPMIGQTNREYYIDHASVKDVAGYSVEVSWPGERAVSEEGFLSVYNTRPGIGTMGGTLSISARQFKAGRGFTCPRAGSIPLVKEYTPADAAGTPFFFHGENIRISDQPGPFVNWNHQARLRLDTTGANNAGVATGISIAQNPSQKVLDCDTSSNSTGGPSLSNINLGPDEKPKKARRSVTIYTGNEAPQSGIVELNWAYF